MANKKNAKKTSPAITILFALVALILGVVIGYFGSTFYFTKNVDFTLTGGTETNIGIGNVYEDTGFVCNINNVDYSSYVTTNYYDENGNEVNSIDTSKTGTFVIQYTLNKDGYHITKQRVVSVVEMEDLEINVMMLGNKYTGDSIYIKAGNTDILIDAGSKASSASAIISYLKGQDGTEHSYVEDGKLEYVIATHAHEDHIAAFPGANGVFNAFTIDTLIDFAGTNSTTKLYQNYQSSVETLVSNGTTHYTAYDCYTEAKGAKRIIPLAAGIEMEVLYNYYYDHQTDNENNYSVCVMLRRGSEQFLLTGDLEGEGESYLVDNNELGHVFFFKSAHHGSYTGSTMKLLNAITPNTVVASCVAFSTEYTSKMDNTFPSKAAVDNYAASNVEHFYVTTMVSSNTAGYEPANGNVIIYSNAEGTYSKCSNSNEDFFNKEVFPIFDKYRSWTRTK